MPVARGDPDSLKAPGFLRDGQFTSTAGCSVRCAEELLALSFPTVTSSYLDTRSCSYGPRCRTFKWLRVKGMGNNSAPLAGEMSVCLYGKQVRRGELFWQLKAFTNLVTLLSLHWWSLKAKHLTSRTFQEKSPRSTFPLGSCNVCRASAGVSCVLTGRCSEY